jgi:hypothetical protein
MPADDDDRPIDHDIGTPVQGDQAKGHRVSPEPKG